MTDRKNGEKTEGRNPDGTFSSGNPGRPRGARHKVTLAVEALLEGQSAALTQTAINRALEGDIAALRLCLERIAPPRRDSPVDFHMPSMETPGDAARAAQAILQAVSDGEITPLEGASVMALIEGVRRTLEVTQLEERIAALESLK